MTGQKGPKVTNRKAHKRKLNIELKQREQEELALLEQQVSQGLHFEKPPTRFNELPLSSRTLRGLEENHFVELTDIQKCALPVALSGLDIRGAAKTGSGKTLAFLLPLLERLWREKWTIHDGLGALVLSPTRELALQTFEVLRKVGRHHTLSAGLIIGGKDLKTEQDAISRMNILVATPGRLLQHMDQTSLFDWSQLKILVLDEADRILDLGFSKTIDAILEELPLGRQTLLFSATQTDSINALARLSLREPVEMSVHAQQEFATPDKLQQKYIICPLSEKMDRIYSFIKSNLKGKIIVFFSSCKEVRFVFEAFCRLQPGIPLAHLHGRQKQTKRMTIFYEFCRKPSAVLFATDVAARGLDFPAVDWVVQADCPEDVDTYIHRVGRTARFDQAGQALLFLLPSEKAILDQLKAKKIPIIPQYAEGKPLPPPKRPIRSQLQALCSQDPEIKYLGQKALVSYVRSVYLNGNKSVFKVEELPVDEFAASLGLAGTPRLRFVERSNAKNASRQLAALQSGTSEGEEEWNEIKEKEDEPKRKKAKELEKNPNSQATSKIDKMFRRKNLDVYSDHYTKLRESEEEAKNVDSEDEGLLKIKRHNHEINSDESDSDNTNLVKTSRRDILKTKKKYTLKNAPCASHVLFDDTGDTTQVLPFTPETKFDFANASQMMKEFMNAECNQMEKIDREDADRVRQARRKARIEKKRKEKETSRNRHTTNTSVKMPRLGGSEDDNGKDDYYEEC